MKKTKPEIHQKKGTQGTQITTARGSKWQGQGFRRVAKYVAGARVRESCKNVGRRGGFEEVLKRCFSRGRRRDLALFDVDVWSLGRSIRGKVVISRYGNVTLQWSFRVAVTGVRMPRLNFVVAGACRRSTFEASTPKSLKPIGFLRSSVWSTCLFWRKSRRKASFLIFKASFLKEVSQKCFVFELQHPIFVGSLAEKLRFWSSKLHFWRKSRRNASFLSFKIQFL